MSDDLEAEERFKQIGEAYYILGYTQKLKTYDQTYGLRSMMSDISRRVDRSMNRIFR